MKAALFFIALVTFCLSAAAQTSPTESNTEKEKERKELETRVLEMLDQAVGDAVNLKLARNRAVVYAVAGDLYWKFDEKRARELFRSSETEMLAANEEAEREKREDDDPYSGLIFEYSTVRNEILPLVAKHDADLALQMLVSTRPPKIAEAMMKAAQPNAKTDGDYLNWNPERMRIQREIALEQEFALLAAEQNPDKAIKLFKDSFCSTRPIRTRRKTRRKKFLNLTKRRSETLPTSSPRRICSRPSRSR